MNIVSTASMCINKIFIYILIYRAQAYVLNYRGTEIKATQKSVLFCRADMNWP